MNTKPRTRRAFLAQVGQGTLAATVGLEVAQGLGLSPAIAEESPPALNFGSLEPLVRLMQETPADHLLPVLAEKLQSGTELRTLVAAGALANARTFGGEDYVGFHTLMAIAPSYHMAQHMPAAQQALPVFKVLYRNTNRIQDHGGCKSEVMHAVAASPVPAGHDAGDALRDAMRQKDLNAAEQMFASLAKGKPEEAFNAVLTMVHDHTEVHRVVLPYRAWDLLGIIGMDQAHSLLRQSLRYCVKAETRSPDGTYGVPAKLLPRMLDEYRLHDYQRGDRKAEEAWVERLSSTIFESTAEQAAAAVASALAEGISPADIGEAITLAANQLILRDAGRTPEMEVTGKPTGSVHGDSIGVHACDSANAWRNMARMSNDRNCCASLILGAYQVALDRVDRGGDFLHWKPLPVEWQVKNIKTTDPDGLLREAENAIRGNLQAHAAGIIHRYGELGHEPRGAFDLMLRYAVSEDGALHAEKFYQTCSEEFAATRPAWRWRHLVALARVTASEYGRPAAGVAEAKALLKV
ncbi:MAG TPA: hypothetical protein VGH65_06995 [Verrucomicrobiaceae bacterium]|jgi:hypothetical protein